MKAALIVSLMFALLSLTGCEVQSAPNSAREAAAAFGNVLDLYNERLDLTAQAIALARNYLPADAPVLTQVDRTRAIVADLHASPALLESPASFERFDVAQRDLTDAISQLLIKCEGVRRLKASRAFNSLQSRLASCAGRIALARDRYTEAARRHNASLHDASINLADRAHLERDMPTFTVPDRAPANHHPRTDFGALRGSLRV